MQDKYATVTITIMNRTYIYRQCYRTSFRASFVNHNILLTLQTGKNSDKLQKYTLNLRLLFNFRVSFKEVILLVMQKEEKCN